MKVAIKNVKIFYPGSQETLCFDASLYIDGKRVGEVSNQGTGGPNNCYILDRAVRKAFLKYCAGISKDEDEVIGELLETTQRKMEYKKWVRNAVVFRLKTDKEGSYRTIKAKGLTQKDMAIAHVHAKYGKKVDYIINERIGKV